MLGYLARRLTRLQQAAGAVAVAGLVLGFLASIDVRLLPPGDPRVAAWLHPLLLVLGIAAGAAAAERGRQIDRRRWEIVEDPLITSGEREYAHKEAERERRVASTVFLLAPVLLGYWLGYQFSGSERPEGGSTVAYLLTVTPMVGFVLGLWLSSALHRPGADG